MRYYDDIAIGAEATFGERTLTEDEIVSFAEKWDPQRFHVDPEAAAESVHGGLIASGFHTVAVAMRVWVDEYLRDVANMGARYLSELAWREPVRPGDTLVISGEVLDKTAPEHTDGHGYLDYELSASVDGEPVMTMVTDLVVERRSD
ncbi:MaoC/PaaZ C-terminal domain-containing protein [Natrinema salsiterrestre]|uniref:MaoC family dehydratase N-terminal domain-containing protein n=1 Tax=Natrinema salsiterrestre TaxID=2950540 RepID=A0A9Q4KXG0_9EURY|nr:MaoC/PaaZ C-terminal domain-containing protein [Natrinema salsiterrestre]MDF9745118.1 MaoC family dehydratase N-terminal domain-containing protein [Natrinema salsiterrestre]